MDFISQVFSDPVWGGIGVGLTILFGIYKIPPIFSKKQKVLKPGQVLIYKNVVFYNASTQDRTTLNRKVNHFKVFDEESFELAEPKMDSMKIGENFYEMIYSRGDCLKKCVKNLTN